MATGIGASGAPCPVRAVCSDRRPSLPWTSPNQPDDDTTARQGLGRPGAGRFRKSRLGPPTKRFGAQTGGQTKRATRRPPPFLNADKPRPRSVRRLVGRLVGRRLVG